MEVASSLFLACLLHLLTVTSSVSAAGPSFVLPVFRDDKTNLHVTFLYRRTPIRRVQHVVDLNGPLLWETCDSSYVSSTYRAPLCSSSHCRTLSGRTHTSSPCFTCTAKPARPGCHNNTCSVNLLNPATREVAIGELAQDAINVQKSNGSTPIALLNMPQYLSGCAPTTLQQKGLPPYIHGVAGFSHSPISLPNQLASHFKFTPKFSLCLSSTPSQWGAIFLGDGPFFLQPNINITSHITQSTPLTVSLQGQYQIQVTKILVNNKPALLHPNTQTMISTVEPFTVLPSSIYNSVVGIFSEVMSKVPRVTAMAPFKLCYNSSSIGSTRVGYAVPEIHLVLHNKDVVWRLFGSNSMVEAKPGVVCLAFVDGGVKAGKGIVIGTHQMVDNVVEFDLRKSTFGFTSSILFYRTTCAN